MDQYIVLNHEYYEEKNEIREWVVKWNETVEGIRVCVLVKLNSRKKENDEKTWNIIIVSTTASAPQTPRFELKNKVVVNYALANWFIGTMASQNYFGDSSEEMISQHDAAERKYQL